MRIGIDARTLGGRFTGDRTYWRGLVSGLAEVGGGHEYRLYTRGPLPDSGEDALVLPANFSRRVVPAGSDRIWSLVALPKACKADGVDVAHVQYSVSPLFTMPVATTVHDISFRLFPELFAAKDRLLLNLSVPDAVRRACRVIGVSENTRRDILAAYGAPPEKVIVTPLAAGPQYRPLPEDRKEAVRAVLKEAYGLTGPYALAVGVLQPRKNLPMLLKAFRAAKRIAGFKHRLVVTGKRGWLTKEIDDALGAAGEGNEIVLTGYVPDEQLPLLYACADAMCYPSLYEGFGLPPLEAMACGCPVIASNTSSLPEVVGDAGILLDPTRPGDWIDAIGKLLLSSVERERLRAAGLAQAKKFDWKRTATLTLSAYEACHNR